MAGISVEAPGRRKSLDTEINMIPMIDLLMVTVSFLLLTAVWTHMGRIEGTTQVPSKIDPVPTEVHARLHLDVPSGDQPFHLTLRMGESVIDRVDVPRDHDPRFAELSKQLRTFAQTHDAELAHDESRIVVMHTDNALRYGEIVAVMDAVAALRQPGNHGQDEQLYRISFATK